MKYSRIFLQLAVLAILFGSFSVGCKSRENGQPSNPFAMNRQTAPPPATFSHQAQYLGQTPGIYVPQLPATTYPSAGATTYPPAGTPMPDSIPANVPLPSGTGTTTTPSGGYGSINGTNGATLFQTSAVTPAPATTNTVVASDWTASDTQASASIPTTAQTVFQNLDSKSNSVSMTDVNGVVKTTSYGPETFAVSSSQMMTTIVSDSTPAAVSAQPQSVYAGKYQQ